MERLDPTRECQSLSEYLIYVMHIATYEYAKTFIDKCDVLDFGSGDGYGANLLSKYCNSIIGIDISSNVIEKASNKYKCPNLSFKKINDINTSKLPFKNESFDVVTSFQVIEHIDNTEKYLDEIYRVLKDEGVFILSTPNRVNRLFKYQRPWNKFHVKEFSSNTLHKHLKLFFDTKNINIYGLTANENIINDENKRRQLLKWITLPFTIPFLPDKLRIRGLKFLSQLQSKKRIEKSITGNDFDFGVKDINITDKPGEALDLIAVCRKK